MTKEVMDAMSKEEMEAYQESQSEFIEEQTLEEYTTAIRDIIYMWRYISASRKSYTIDTANYRVRNNKVQIKSFYEEKEPAASAAIDVDFCCG